MQVMLLEEAIREPKDEPSLAYSSLAEICILGEKCCSAAHERNLQHGEVSNAEMT
jgi:hypothetical protein